MKRFLKEFQTLRYVIKNAESILLVAHSRPDPDTAGANAALYEYLIGLGKRVDIVCTDSFPAFLKGLFCVDFLSLSSVDTSQYDVIIAADSVDRGFHTIAPKLSEQQVSVLIDHHPDLGVAGDVEMIDAKLSSACEIVFEYLQFAHAAVTARIATALLSGILFDTGCFQHSCTSPRVMEIASELVRRGAVLEKIRQTIFDKQSISALKLWGVAFQKAKMNPKNGMLATVVTKQDVETCGASVEDIYQVASILSAVPETRFSLVLSEREEGLLRVSMRAMDGQGVDVSSIAQRFGGGGHRLASGFEIRGKVVETKEGWMVV